jgi:autotransporter adhesin
MHKKKSRSDGRTALLAACGIVIACTGGVLAPQQAQAQFICEGSGGGDGGANAVGFGSVACGNAAVAGSSGTTAVGSFAGFGSTSAFNVNNTFVGNNSGNNVDGSNNVAFGTSAGSIVTGSDNTAIGNSAGREVNGIWNTAIGSSAGFQAEGFANSAIGRNAGVFVTGNDNVAIGTGAGSGTDGNPLVVSNTVALGNNSRASANGAVAIGNGAQATRQNQFAFGTASNTYTMAGVASAASQTAQGAPTHIVTSNASGDLAAYTPAQLGLASAGEIGAINEQLNSINAQLAALTKEARRGIAASAALAVAMTPSAPGKTTVSVNSGFFKGETGVGVALAHRLNFATPFIVHGSYANAGGNGHIGRVGFGLEF